MDENNQDQTPTMSEQELQDWQEWDAQEWEKFSQEGSVNE